MNTRGHKHDYKKVLNGGVPLEATRGPKVCSKVVKYVALPEDFYVERIISRRLKEV